MVGVDASVELVKELERLGRASAVAKEAPRSKALYGFLARGINAQDPSGLHRNEFVELTNALIERLSVWWSPDAYRRLPVMVPWCVRDRSCRYDQGPESWGAPRVDAYFRDDNSIIKKLPLTCTIVGPSDHPYQGRRPWRGFTACHIWRDLPDGTLAGEDPWLYSFMPNLVWLPSWLAPLTDRQSSVVQQTLQRTSIALFRRTDVAPQLRPYIERAWAKLHPPASEHALLKDRLAIFEPDESFYRRRVKYLDRFVAGCEAVLSGDGLTSKLISSRYTAGLPLLEPVAIAAFGTVLADYRAAVEEGASVLT